MDLTTHGSPVKRLHDTPALEIPNCECSFIFEEDFLLGSANPLEMEYVRGMV